MVIIYDIETHTFGHPSPERDEPVLFGYYSTTDGKLEILDFRKDAPTIQKVLASPDVKITFNGRNYDNVILHRHGFHIKGDFIDLRTFLKRTLTGIRPFSLDNVCKHLGLPSKKGIDYSLFRDTKLIDAHIDEISEYLRQDVLVTVALYERFQASIEATLAMKKHLKEAYGL